jgi:serine/threonine protein kinase
MPTLPHVGDTFGRYRIDSQVGRGGMGTVYAATDTSIGRRVALKVVSVALGDQGQEQEFRLRFEREASVLARLDSPHVIAIYDYGDHEGTPYIATQFVGGGDLGDLLHRRGPMPPSLALRVCAQVADALHDAHRVGVVHRDVKPTNVLLRESSASGVGTSGDLHAYLCDFGIARTATDGITQAGAVAGTWSYLAPECGRGAPGTPASDVYALGCLLWATLTGSPPYRGSDVEVAVAHQRAPVPQLGRADELSQRVDAILRRCLAKDPSERYADADQARTDLLAAAGLPDPGPLVPGPPPSLAPTLPRPSGPPSGPGSGPGSVPPVSLGPLPPRLSPPTPPPGPRRRRTTGVVALVCAAVVAVAGGVFAVAQVGGDDEPLAGPGTGTGSGPTSTVSSSAPEPAPEPTGPVRVDSEGPITGDQDGDGLGDLELEYYHTVSRRGRADDTFTDVTTWRSTGTRLVQQGPAVREESGPRNRSDQPLWGDFDGDDVAERIVVQTFRKAGRMQVVGELSGGGEVGGEVRIPTRPYTYPAVLDLDGDGSDDLVLQYYSGEFEKGPMSFAGALLRDGRLRPVRDLVSVPYAYAVSTYEVGDFDGDGLGDLAVVHQPDGIDGNPQELTLWLGQESGGMRRGPARTYTGGFGDVFLRADVDGDDDDELVQVDTSLVGTLQVIDVRDGQLTKARGAGAIEAAGDEAPAFGVVDVDGDGRDDVVGISEATPRRSDVVVAVSDGRRLVPRRFATWKRDFDTSEFFSYVTVTTRSW